MFFAKSRGPSGDDDDEESRRKSAANIQIMQQRQILDACNNIGGAIGRHGTRLSEIEKRLSQMDGINGLKYMGVWRDDMAYAVDNAVTFRGGVWVCKRLTAKRPGTNSDWQLAVKSGNGPETLAIMHK